MQRGIRGARAAALLLIASGAAGFASAYIDERWIFIAALALIGLFEGIAIGVISAIIAVFADELVVHFAFTFVPDRDTFLLVGGIVAVILGSAIRAMRSRPRLGASHQRVFAHEDSRLSNLEDELSLARGRIAELDAQLAQRAEVPVPMSDGAQAARIAELESRFEAERMRAGDLEAQLAAERSRADDSQRAIDDHTSRAAALQRTIDENLGRASDLEMQLATEREGHNARGVELQRTIDNHAERAAELQRAIEDNVARAADLESQLTAERSRVDDHTTRAASLESQLAAERTHSADLQQTLEDNATLVAHLESRLAAERSRSIDIQRAADEASAQLAAERERTAELQRSIETATAQQATAFDSQLSRIAELERQVAEAYARVSALEQALETARATSASLASRVEELEQAIDASDATLEQQKQEAIAERDRLQSEWNEKLNTIVGHLASDHESDLGEAVMEREEARAEVRNLNSRIAELKRMLEQKSSGAPEYGFAVVNLAEPKKPNVLLVHRDAELRTTARHALERGGYNVTTAGDGLEALRIAMTERPDVILAEMQMPKMDGRALVQLLKSRSETANTKIVLIGTSIPPSEDSKEFRADDFIVDASDFEALKETVAGVLR